MASNDAGQEANDTTSKERTREMEVAWTKVMDIRGFDIPVYRFSFYASAVSFGTVAYTLARVMLLRPGGIMATLGLAIITVAAVFPVVCRAAHRRWYLGALSQGGEQALMMFVFAGTSLPLIAVMVPVVILSLAAAAEERIAGMWLFLLLLWLVASAYIAYMQKNGMLRRRASVGAGSILSGNVGHTAVATNEATEIQMSATDTDTDSTLEVVGTKAFGAGMTAVAAMNAADADQGTGISEAGDAAESQAAAQTASDTVPGEDLLADVTGVGGDATESQAAAQTASDTVPGEDLLADATGGDGVGGLEMGGDGEAAATGAVHVDQVGGLEMNGDGEAAATGTVDNLDVSGDGGDAGGDLGGDLAVNDANTEEVNMAKRQMQGSAAANLAHIPPDSAARLATVLLDSLTMFSVPFST